MRPESLISLFSSFFFNFVYGALLLISAETLETDDTVLQGEQSVITAETNVLTGMNVRSALLVKDIAGLDKLTVSSLRAKSLCFRVTAVLCGANTLFMSE